MNEKKESTATHLAKQESRTKLAADGHPPATEKSITINSLDKATLESYTSTGGTRHERPRVPPIPIELAKDRSLKKNFEKKPIIDTTFSPRNRRSDGETQQVKQGADGGSRSTVDHQASISQAPRGSEEPANNLTRVVAGSEAKASVEEAKQSAKLDSNKTIVEEKGSGKFTKVAVRDTTPARSTGRSSALSNKSNENFD